MELSRLIMDEKSGIKEYLEFIEENQNFNINELDQFNRTLLQIAVVSQKWDIAADLISRGINVNNQDNNNNTVLHYLCEKPSNI